MKEEECAMEFKTKKELLDYLKKELSQTEYACVVNWIGDFLDFEYFGPKGLVTVGEYTGITLDMVAGLIVDQIISECEAFGASYEYTGIDSVNPMIETMSYFKTLLLASRKIKRLGGK